MQQRKTLMGLFGILGIWLTAGLALPFVNILNNFTPSQLMVFRGWLTALMAFILLRGKIMGIDKYAWLIAITLPFATLGLFEGIRNWGAGPTIIVVTATPLVNFVIAIFLKKRIVRAAIIGLVLMLVGVIIARWGGVFQWTGFAWSILGTIMNGILYEWFARSKSPSLKKCFWACVGMGTLGLLLTLDTPWPPLLSEPKLLVMVIGFAFVGGFLYWLANLTAFENLPTDSASVLAQGETPAVLIMAGVLLGETLTLLQWLGLMIALFGAWYLSRWLSKQESVTNELA